MGKFLEQAELAENPNFLKTVKIATKKVAVAIVGEAINQDKLEYHNKRHKLATQVLTGDMTQQFAEAIAAFNPSITIESPDGDIEFLVTAVFNDLAGVMSTER